MRRRAIAGLTLALVAAGCGGPLGRELFLRQGRLHRAEAIVVLGNRPPRDATGAVAPETARRVRRGVELYRRGLAPRLLVTGGPAPGGGTEADVMAAYARELGVPEDAILAEPLATDTAQNAGYSVALVCEGATPCSPDVIVVSSPYHLRRAVRLFECAGARPQPAATEIPDDREYQTSFTAYEYAVRLAAVVDDTCVRARAARATGSRR
jgi:uncharacterized SAM-binding protein YcdF (DUF218 family)